MKRPEISCRQGKILCLVAGLALLGLATQALGAGVEAKKDGVQVYADATNKSAVVSQMKGGETLPSLERKGMYWQVKLPDGKTGYVSVLAVKHKAEGSTSLAKAIDSVVKEGRTSDGAGSARARSAVMGVRGLADDDNMANAGNIRPNLRAVFRMEDRHVSQKHVQRLGDSVFKEIAQKAAVKP